MISVPVSPSTIITFLYTVPNAKYVLSLEAVGIEAWLYIPPSPPTASLVLLSKKKKRNNNDKTGRGNSEGESKLNI